MRLSDVTAIWGIKEVALVGSRRDVLSPLAERTGLTVTDDGGCLLTAVGRAPSSVAITIDEFLGIVGDTDRQEAVVLLARDVDHQAPLIALGGGLADAGFSIDTMGALDLTETPVFLLARRGEPAPSALIGTGPTSSSDDVGPARTRSVFNLWQLYRFFGAPPASSKSPAATTDTESVADALLRERARSEAEHQDRVDAALARAAAAEERAAELAETLARTRASRSYLAGRMVAESVRDPARAAKIGKRLFSAKTPVKARAPQPGGSDKPPSPLARNGVVAAIRRPAPRLGRRGPGVFMVAGRDRRRTWRSAAIVSLPMPAESLDALAADTPELVVIEASGLNSGPWNGVGRGEEIGNAMELLHLIDGSRILGIPTAFIWDVPPGTAPGGWQVARACDVVCAAHEGLLPPDVPVVNPGYDVRRPARTGIETGRTGARILSLDPGIAIDGIEVDHTTAEELTGRMRAGAPLAHSLIWLGAADLPAVAASAAARGTAIVGSRNALRIRGFARYRDFRRLSQEERAAAAESLMNEAWTNLHNNQRRLHQSFSVPGEVATLGQLAGKPVQPHRRIIGVLTALLGETIPETAAALAPLPTTGKTVAVWTREPADAIARLPETELMIVGSPLDAAGARVDSWLISLSATPEHSPTGLLDDVSRLVEYGYERLALTDGTGRTRFAVIPNDPLELSQLELGPDGIRLPEEGPLRRPEFSFSSLGYEEGESS